MIVPDSQSIAARLAAWHDEARRHPLLAAVVTGREDVRLVGGSVRDLLLGIPSHDHDFTMPSGAFEFARGVADACGGSFVPLKEARGMARVVLGPDHADFADYQAPTLDADLRARDLTINAMALDTEGILVDPCGGREDLTRGLLRCPSEDVLRSDPLRVLRVVRFACRLGFEVESATREALKSHAGRLAAVSGERVRDEFFHILASDRPHAGVGMLDDCGALSVMLPALDALRGLEQGSFHHLDVFAHTLLVQEAIETHALPLACAMLDDAAPLLALLDAPIGATGRTSRALLQLAALLHDVGKPAARHLDKKGRVSYRGHEATGSEMIPEMAERLKLSSIESGILTRMVAWHLEPLQMKAPGNLRARHIRRYFAKIGRGAVETLVLALADSHASQGPSNTEAVRAALHTRVARMLAWHFSGEAARCVPLLNGSEIGELLSIPPGPEIKRLLERLSDAQADRRVTNREEAAALLLREATQARQTPS